MANMKRDPFARIELHRAVERTCTPKGCKECGQEDRPEHPLYRHWLEKDSGGSSLYPFVYCSWSCFQTYNNVDVP
jgi:hypothetical protein